MKEFDITQMNAALQSLDGWLTAAGLSYVIIGGLAVALVGQPRITKDIDATVWISDTDLDELVKQARAFDIHPRTSDAITFARRSRTLLLLHLPPETTSPIPLDISLGALPFEEEMIARAQSVTLGDITLPIARPEDLVISKAIPMRPRDVADIETLLRVHPDIDRKRVRSMVAAFAEALEAPEIVTALDRLFEQVPQKAKKAKTSKSRKSKS